jgi:hypothetical protein
MVELPGKLGLITLAECSHSNAMVQSAPLFRQLDSGIRALDIRYALEENKLLLVHGSLTPFSDILFLTSVI